MHCEDLKKRYEACKSDRSTIQNIWDEIEKYILPYRGDFFTDQSHELQIEWRKTEVFDSTAVDAAQTLAASIHGALTSFVSQWFQFRWRDKRLHRITEAMQWIEEAALTCFQALQDSDFGLEVSEAYLDLVGFGTATIIQEELTTPSGNFEGLDFQSISLKHSFFEVDHHGKVLYYYKRLMWTPGQIITKFGIENVPEDIVEKYKNEASSSTKLEVVFAVYPREGVSKSNTLTRLPKDKRPFGFKYFLHRDATMLGEEGGYYEMPAYVPKWRKVNDSAWGHSPAMVQLSNIKTLNKLVELTLAALGKVVDPATIVTERGLLSDLDLAAGGLTVVRNKDDLWAYESKARFDAGDLKINDLRQTIRQAFFVDQLELKESPAMSATEANIRYELMQRLLGPTLGRLQSDFLDPCLERTFKILYRAGKIKPPPEIVSEFNPDIDIEYVGPLPKAQRTQTAAAIDSWLTQVEQLAGVDEEVLTVPDWEEIVKGTADIKGVPAIMIKSERKRRAEKRQREQMAAKQAGLAGVTAEGAALEQVGKGLQAVKEAGTTVEELDNNVGQS